VSDAIWQDGDVVRFPVVGQVSLHAGSRPEIVVLRNADGSIAAVMQRSVVEFYLSETCAIDRTRKQTESK